MSTTISFSGGPNIAIKIPLSFLPAHVIADWQLKYPSWNKFILSTYKLRYDELLKAFGSAVFQPINVRVRDYLANYARNQSSADIPISHQTLANELGTTRVVISRILKSLEKDKVVKLNRGSITLLKARA